jgi:hypothetical protein
LSGFGADRPPLEKRWSLPFLANSARRRRSAIHRAAHCHYRLMTYALIASKMATLIAIMIKKNFPIALPL